MSIALGAKEPRDIKSQNHRAASVTSSRACLLAVHISHDTGFQVPSGPKT